MTKEYLGWEALNELGRKYHELVQEGNGLTVENRSPEQVKIVNTIITGTKDYLFMIALRLLKKSARVNSEARVSLASEEERIGQSKIVSIEDLVQEGAISVIERMHNYDPQRGSIESFIAINAVAVMHRRATELLYSVYIPDYLLKKLRDLSTTDNYSRTSAEIIEALSEDMEQGTEGEKIIAAQLAYDSMKGRLVQIDQFIPGSDDEQNNQRLFCRRTFEPRETRILSSQTSPEEDTGRSEFQTRIVRTMEKRLTIKEQFIVEKYLGTDGKERAMERVRDEFCAAFDVDITRQAVYNIFAKAIRKLRHPANRQFLIEQQPSTVRHLAENERHTKNEKEAWQAFRELTARETMIVQLYGF